MSEIWADLQTKMDEDLKESGLLKSVFGSMQFLELSDGTLRLGVYNSLSLGIAQNELKELIQQNLQAVLGRPDVYVSLEATASTVLELVKLSGPAETSQDVLRSPQIELRPKWFLNADYKLDQFVNGTHSNFAYKCVELVSAPVQSNMRQLFIYGASGMGKTHLLHALGWQFKKNSPQLNIKVFNADEFINDYHLYISKKQMAEFRGKYRLKTDVLLIDDIHSMGRAKGAQEELFNIFNYYEQTGKFIAFTSDKSPQQLENFEPRLLTRFQGGLSAEIELADFTTRLEILQCKQLRYGFSLSKEVLEHLAGSISNSVRSLEGALFKVGSYQKMKGTSLSFEELSRLIPPTTMTKTKISVESILDESAKAAGLKISDLKSISRKREVVVARNQAMLRMREELSLSFAEIGRIFQKDHSTIMSAIKRARSAQTWL